MFICYIVEYRLEGVRKSMKIKREVFVKGENGRWDLILFKVYLV